MTNKDTPPQTFDFPDFPDAPDFISEPPKYTLAQMIKLSEKMLPYWNKKRYEEGSVYLKKVEMDEFVL